MWCSRQDASGPGASGRSAGAQDLDLLVGIENVPFQAAQIARRATQPQALLGASLCDLDQIPRQAARADPAACHEVAACHEAHIRSAGGRPFALGVVM